MRNLVVFYSLEGNTRLIAESIAKAINADVLELKTKKKYSDKGFKKYFWGGKSVIFKEKPELLYLDKDINQYDNIFIGTPIWVGTYAPPLNTFLKNNKIEKNNRVPEKQIKIYGEEITCKRIIQNLVSNKDTS